MKLIVGKKNDGGTYYLMWCPGCDEAVMIDDKWSWNGDRDKPTFNPSILTRVTHNEPRICHSFLTDGVWNYLSDCTHSMAGQQVPLPDLPDWLVS